VNKKISEKKKPDLQIGSVTYYYDDHYMYITCIICRNPAKPWSQARFDAGNAHRKI